MNVRRAPLCRRRLLRWLLPERKHTIQPLRRFLVGVGDAEHLLVLVGLANDLEADRHPVAVLAAAR